MTEIIEVGDQTIKMVVPFEWDGTQEKELIQEVRDSIKITIKK